MKITQTERGLKLMGRLTHQHRHLFHGITEEALSSRETSGHLHLDCTEVHDLDSHGLAMMLSLAHKAQARHMRLILGGCSSPLRRIVSHQKARQLFDLD